ncbi:zinc finger protein [Macleaya cordata]|uniref:Zinc finger protein n=1 Tax=Macleaya cordata TaxID=56857 RepID=A0A200R1H9_MACCD|nr:zinc finger protein [Macleaya cordata]
METKQLAITNSEKEEESLDEKCMTSFGMMSETEGLCSICLETIALQETALIKGCEHAYCVTCILRWATYKKNPSCPQCKQLFEFLIVHRSLDGSIHDYMFEESICLLLRATWFVPLTVEAHEEEAYEQHVDIYDYQIEYDDDDDSGYLDEVNMSSSSSLRIGNRMWGDNGFVRGGRKEARPVNRKNFSDLDAGPSRGAKKKETMQQNTTGRRAKRALKREAADRAAVAVAASKNQQHSPKLITDFFP